MNPIYNGVLPDTRTIDAKNKDFHATELAPMGGMIPKFRVTAGQWYSYTPRDQDGSGTCFPANAPVLMEDMEVNEISKIRIGDLVITHKGNRQKVTNIFKRKWQGNTNLFKIRGISDVLECTAEHPIFAIKKIKDEKPISEQPDFYRADELKNGDWVAVPIDRIVKDTSLYSYEKDPDFLWALGLYLAEGSLDKYKVVFTLHKKETYYYERLKNTFSRYGSNVTVSYRTKSNAMTVSLQGQKWVKIFEQLGSKLCSSKKLDTRLMFIEPSLQMNIVEGVLDGDGHYANDRTILVSTSRSLVSQIKKILLRNFIYSFEQKRKKQSGKKDVWTLEYSKTSRYSFIKDNFFFVQITNKKIKRNFQGGHIYNIEVENDNSYIVNGVAVHNCVAQTLAKNLEVEYKRTKPDFVAFSATPIYQKRSNAPSGGMQGAEALQIIVAHSTCRESDCPSQSMSDVAVDSAKLPANFDTLSKEIDPVASMVLPIDFDYIAAIVELYGSAMLHFDTSYHHWCRSIPLAGGKGGGVRHSVAAVDAFTLDNVQYILVEDSWGTWSDNQYSLAPKKQRLITREMFYDGVFFGGVLTTFVYAQTTPSIKIKPFTLVMEFNQTSNDIKALQDCLKAHGFFPANQPSTGFYGAITARAVLQFQLKYAVAPVAELQQLAGRRVGVLTISKLNELYA